MATIVRSTADSRWTTAVGMLVAGLLAIAAVYSGWPAWICMWILAVSIYAALKWLTFAGCPAARRAAWQRSLAYLLLWPGMNAAGFLTAGRSVDQPRSAEWWLAFGKLGLGLVLVFGAAALAGWSARLVAAWLGMAGVVFVLHFGLFHLLSLAWRSVGIDAPPIMDGALRSSSLAEFWGQRWNRAFRDVAHAWVFRPLLPRLGLSGATVAVFVASGLVHDLVISVPARGGWGLPTLYFVIQGVATLIERSPCGRRHGLGRGVRGRLFCAAVVCSPLGLLFHRPFLERIVLPMLEAFATL